MKNRGGVDRENGRQLLRLLLALSVVHALCAPTFVSAQSENPEPVESEPLPMFTPWTPWVLEWGGGLVACDRIGAPVFFSQGIGDPSATLVTFEGLRLNDPQTGAADWMTLSPATGEIAHVPPTAWQVRYRNGGVGEALELREKEGRRSVPVTRVAFVEGPEAYKRTWGEFGRGIGRSWGLHLGFEKHRGAPTESSIRHSINHVGGVLEGGLPGGWYARISGRKHEGDREWKESEGPYEGLHREDGVRDATFFARGKGLAAERFSFLFWKRDLFVNEKRLTGLDMAWARDVFYGGIAEGTWRIAGRHRLVVSGEVERRSHAWDRKDARIEWIRGLWVADEILTKRGTVRIGVRTEDHWQFGVHAGGEVGWVGGVGRGTYHVLVRRGFRAPGETERRYSHSFPEVRVATGVEAGYSPPPGKVQKGVRAYAWWQDGHPVWRRVESGTPDGAWLLSERDIRVLGALFWSRWANERGEWAGASMRVTHLHLQDSEGESALLAPIVLFRFGGELNRPLPLRETALVAGVAGRGWTRTHLPEGGTQKQGVVLDAEIGFEISSFRAVFGAANLFNIRVSRSPFLPLLEPGTGEADRYGCVPRNACQSPRNTYFGMSLTLLD